MPNQLFFKTFERVIYLLYKLETGKLLLFVQLANQDNWFWFVCHCVIQRFLTLTDVVGITFALPWLAEDGTQLALAIGSVITSVQILDSHVKTVLIKGCQTNPFYVIRLYLLLIDWRIFWQRRATSTTVASDLTISFLSGAQQFQSGLQHLRISIHRTSTGPSAQGITEI